MNVLQMQFLDVSVKVGVAGGWRAEEKGGRIESEVCYSVTHKVQFNANCKMIS